MLDWITGGTLLRLIAVVFASRTGSPGVRYYGYLHVGTTLFFCFM